jgi:hypothetical protein
VKEEEHFEELLVENKGDGNILNSEDSEEDFQDEELGVTIGN